MVKTCLFVYNIGRGLCLRFYLHLIHLHVTWLSFYFSVQRYRHRRHILSINNYFFYSIFLQGGQLLSKSLLFISKKLKLPSFSFCSCVVIIYCFEWLSKHSYSFPLIMNACICYILERLQCTCDLDADILPNYIDQ